MTPMGGRASTAGAPSVTRPSGNGAEVDTSRRWADPCASPTQHNGRMTPRFPDAQAAVTWAFAIEPLSNDRYALFQGGDLSLVTIDQVRSFIEQAIERPQGLGGDSV